MMKLKRYLVIIVSIVFVLASVQPALAKVDDDLLLNHYPKVVTPGKVVKGSISSDRDVDCYSFFSNGGTYKIKLYVDDLSIDEYGFVWPLISLDYGSYSFYSVNEGWQMPEYHMDEIDGVYCDEGWKKDSNGWYVCTVKIGKIKKARKMGFSISADDKIKYKFEILGKKFADPKKPVIKSVKGKKHAMKVKWKKGKNAKGYLIQISKNKGWGDNYQEIKVKGKKSSKTIKNLKKGRYYVKICSYKKVKGVTAYSEWTKAKKVIVK